MKALTIEERQAFNDLKDEALRAGPGTGERGDALAVLLADVEAGGVAWAAVVRDEMLRRGARSEMKRYAQSVGGTVDVRGRQRSTVAGTKRRTDSGTAIAVQLDFGDWDRDDVVLWLNDVRSRLVADSKNRVVGNALLALFERHPAATVAEALAAAGTSLQQWLDTFDAKAA